MVKVVIHEDYGGYGLNEKGRNRAFEISGDPRWLKYGYDGEVSRMDPTLVQVVEEMGYTSGGAHVIEEVPEGTEFLIHEYDGRESIWEKNEIDWIVAK